MSRSALVPPQTDAVLMRAELMVKSESALRLREWKTHVAVLTTDRLTLYDKSSAVLIVPLQDADIAETGDNKPCTFEVVVEHDLWLRAGGSPCPGTRRLKVVDDRVVVPLRAVSDDELQWWLSAFRGMTGVVESVNGTPTVQRKAFSVSRHARGLYAPKTSRERSPSGTGVPASHPDRHRPGDESLARYNGGVTQFSSLERAVAEQGRDADGTGTATRVAPQLTDPSHGVAGSSRSGGGDPVASRASFGHGVGSAAPASARTDGVSSTAAASVTAPDAPPSSLEATWAALTGGATLTYRPSAPAAPAHDDTAAPSDTALSRGRQPVPSRDATGVSRQESRSGSRDRGRSPQLSIARLARDSASGLASPRSRVLQRDRADRGRGSTSPVPVLPSTFTPTVALLEDQSDAALAQLRARISTAQHQHGVTLAANRELSSELAKLHTVRSVGRGVQSPAARDGQVVDGTQAAGVSRFSDWSSPMSVEHPVYRHGSGGAGAVGSVQPPPPPSSSNWFLGGVGGGVGAVAYVSPSLPAASAAQLSSSLSSSLLSSSPSSAVAGASMPDGSGAGKALKVSVRAQSSRSVSPRASVTVDPHALAEQLRLMATKRLGLARLLEQAGTTCHGLTVPSSV